MSGTETIKQLENVYGSHIRNQRLIIDGYFRSYSNETTFDGARWYLLEIIKIGSSCTHFFEDARKAWNLLDLLLAFEEQDGQKIS